MRRIIPLLALATALVACQDKGITVPSDDVQLAAARGRPVHRVIGGGSIVREDIEGAPRETYGFQASKDADGTVTGQAEVHFPSNDVKMHIDVRCLAIERNQAWLSGVVTRTDNPDTPVGRVFVWQVQDNGEGQAAPPDRISNFAYGDFGPMVCRWKSPMTTYPWDNGNVKILTPGGPSLADLVGTWDATFFHYYPLPDLDDTLDVLALGRGARWTVAPDGSFSLLWWAPGVIFENVVGVMDVVNGQLIQTFYEDPTVIAVQDVRVTGNSVAAGGDFAVGHDWDGDDVEDPSRVVSEWKRKRKGVVIGDVAGTWDATVWRYTSTADPAMTVDLVAGGETITLTVGLDSRYTVAFTSLGWTSSGELLLEGNQMLIRNGESQAFTYALNDGTWSFSGPNEFDFDDDGTPEPATLEAVLVRR